MASFSEKGGSTERYLDGIKLGSVSRHGLLRAGIVCPYCGLVAARTGDHHLIHVTRFGEAVHCTTCPAILLASPDDDIDPVNPSISYDETLYHKFARPEKTRIIHQRITMVTPRMDDWVVIVTDRPLTLGSNPPCTFRGQEGRVVAVSPGEGYTIALSGNAGLGGGGLAPGEGLGGAWLELGDRDIAVMVTPTLHPGDLVQVLRGPHSGARGRMVTTERGMVRLQLLDGGELSGIPIERIEKVVEHERTI